MKKLLALLLAATMMLGLAGTVAVAADDDFVTLNWYTKGSKPADYDLVMAEVNAYLKEKINAEVNINFINWGTEWDTFVSTQVATNEGAVDIMFTAVWDRLYQHVAAGYLIPLNGDPDYGNLLEDYGQDVIAGIDPSFLTGNEINGVLYGISCNKELAANHGFVINPFLVEKYNIDVSSIKTLADLTPIFEVVKAGEPDLLACVDNGAAISFMAPFVSIAGDGNIVGQYDDDRSPDILNQYATPEWKELLDLAQEWYEKGYIHPDTIQLAPTCVTDYLDGLYLISFQSMKPGKGAEMAIENVASIEVVLTDTVIRTKDVGGSMLAIVEGSQNPERAMEFLGLLENDVYLLNLITYGIEGIHYNFTEDGRIEITPQGQDSWGMYGNSWMYGNQFNNYITIAEAPDKWDQFRAFNAAGHPVQSLGFTYDVTDIAPVLSALQSVMTEYNSLFVGALDVETKLPEFLAALDAAGMQQLLDDVQTQYDAWLNK